MASPSKIRAGQAFIELFADDTRLVRGLRRAQARLNAFGRGVSRMGTRLLGVGAAIAAPLNAATGFFARTGDALDKMSARTGVGAEALAELGFAAEQSGATIENVGKAIQRMNRRIGRITAGQGTASQVEALEALGLSAERLDGLKPEERFLAIADAMANMGDRAEAAGLAQRAFGTEVDQLLPLLLQGGDAIEALRQEHRDLGLTMSDEATKAAARLTDALNILWNQAKMAAFQIGASLAPVAIRFADNASRVARRVLAWIKANGDLVRTVAAVASITLAAGAALLLLGGIIVGLGAVLGGLATLITTIGTVGGAAIAALTAAFGALMSPLGLVLSGVAALGAVILIATGAGGAALGWLADRFGDLRDEALAAWRGIADSLASGDLALAGEIAMAALELVWARGVNALMEVWSGLQQFLAESMIKASTGAVAAFLIAINAIRNAWHNLVIFMTDAWAAFLDFARPATETLTRVILKAAGFTDEQIDTQSEGIEANVDRELAKQKSVLDELNQISRANIEANNEDLERELSELAQQERERIDVLRSEGEADTEAAERRLDALEDRLRALREEAAEGRDAADQGDGAPRPESVEDLLDRFRDAMDGAAEIDRSLSTPTVGTFNAASLASLQGAGFGVQERIARSSEQTAINTRRIERELLRSLLEFS